jgi:hypothetical protein
MLSIGNVPGFLCWKWKKYPRVVFRTSRLKLKLIYDRQWVSQYALVSGSHLESVTRFVSSVWRLLVSWYGTPSLMRGWVCNLLVQLLLGLARAVTLRCKSRRTHDHILLSHMRLPNLEGQVPVFISPRNRMEHLCPRTLGKSRIVWVLFNI